MINYSLNSKLQAAIFKNALGLQLKGPVWYEAKDIEKILGIDKNKLFYWVRTHRLLKPSYGMGRGPGTRSKYSIQNLLEIAIIKELAQFGFDLNGITTIKKVLDGTKVVFDKGQKKEASNEDKKWIELTEKLSYYDLAFLQSLPIGLTLYKDDDIFRIKQWEFSNDAPEEDERKEIQEHKAVLKINITALAKSLAEKIKR